MFALAALSVSLPCGGAAAVAITAAEWLQMATDRLRAQRNWCRLAGWCFRQSRIIARVVALDATHLDPTGRVVPTWTRVGRVYLAWRSLAAWLLRTHRATRLGYIYFDQRLRTGRRALLVWRRLATWFLCWHRLVTCCIAMGDRVCDCPECSRAWDEAA